MSLPDTLAFIRSPEGIAALRADPESRKSIRDTINLIPAERTKYRGTTFGSPKDVERERRAEWCEWRTIRERVGGLVSGATVAIVGASGEGKTAIFDAIQAGYVREGIPSARAECEMGPAHVFLGVARGVLQRDLTELPALPTHADLEAFVDRALGGNRFRDLYDYITHDGSQQLPLMLGGILSYLDEHPACRVVFLDYLSRCKSEDEALLELARWEREEAIFDTFKTELKARGIIAYVGIQYNRDAYEQGAKRGKAQLSGSISQLFFTDYLAEISTDFEAKETTLTFTKCRMSIPRFTATYSYRGCQAVLNNNRGFLMLEREEIDAASRVAETDALIAHAAEWKANGCPPALAGTQPLSVRTNGEDSYVGMSEFAAAWNAYRGKPLLKTVWPQWARNALLGHGFRTDVPKGERTTCILWKTQRKDTA